MNTLNEYWLALERLQKNKPIILPKGSLINKDTVALEAGRKRGSIKKSRKNFTDLITAIDLANQIIDHQGQDIKTKLANERSKKANYRELYHQSLNRELMLLDRLAQLEKEQQHYTNVVPLFER